MEVRPRRSWLYMPASNARAIEKGGSLPADGIVLDLEDAVAPEAKATARMQAVEAVRAGGFGRRETIIRINGLDTPWGPDDVEAAAASGADGVLVPKIDSADMIAAVSDALNAHAPASLRLWAMVETPLAILRAHEMAAASRAAGSRLAGFVIGPNDLVKESHARLVPGRAPLVPWLMHCIAAARAYGLAILDGVYNDIADADGFAAECRQGRDMGFDGKTLIHPAQIEPCNAIFGPSAAEIEEARAIAALFDLPENQGKGVVRHDGRMVERMHADIARRTLAIAAAIGRA